MLLLRYWFMFFFQVFVFFFHWKDIILNFLKTLCLFLYLVYQSEHGYCKPGESLHNREMLYIVWNLQLYVILLLPYPYFHHLQLPICDAQNIYLGRARFYQTYSYVSTTYSSYLPNKELYTPHLSNFGKPHPETRVGKCKIYEGSRTVEIQLKCMFVG